MTGALAARMAIIVSGWALPLRLTAELFGGFLIATGIAFASQRQHELDPERSLALRLLRRLLPVSDHYQGQRFLLRRDGMLMATPLLAALVLLDTVDGFFMVPITLIFAITKSPLVVAASNLFALLGLRDLSLLLSGLFEHLPYLRLGIGVAIALVGLDLLVSDLLTVPPRVTAGGVVLALAAAVAISVVRHAPAAQQQHPP